MTARRVDVTRPPGRPTSRTRVCRRLFSGRRIRNVGAESGCPPWCEIDHAAIADGETAAGGRDHEVEVTRLHRNGELLATVHVSVYEDTDEGTITPPCVLVETEDGLDDRAALALAAGILSAVDLMRGGR
ncbi:DUF6907 domain-containing protein [Plantactinospora sp. WMMB782]|uniref:DUF6907 domain-containing protein n=1 Tax=Plantactinospora sp. WMMB782 TaxID=3404121 RepID=UPI003B95C9DD